MEFKRWKFSQQVQPELEEFLKIVENNKKVTQNIENKLWEQILPKLPQTNMSNLSIDSKNDVITINDDDDVVEEKKFQHLTGTSTPDISIISLSFQNQPDNITEIDLCSIKNSVKECLNDNRLLEEKDIKTISNDLNKALLTELIIYLNDNVSNNGLLKLGETLSALLFSNDQINRLYCQIILLNKLLKSETSKTFMAVVSLFLKNYPEILKEEIYLPLLQKHLEQIYIFEELYKLLSQNEKENLVRDFLFCCNELEDDHLFVIQLILPQVTEFSVKIRLINLMSNSADKFKDNKMYMKILLEIIKTLNHDFLDQEPLLYGIIEKNKTIFKLTAEKALNMWFNNCNSD